MKYAPADDKFWRNLAFGACVMAVVLLTILEGGAQ